MRRVVVLGAGIAGTAAALAAAREGARVTLLAHGVGASTLAGGALDDAPWEEGAQQAAAPLALEARAVLDALGGYRVGEHGALVAVTTGIVRPARGTDAALLDLAELGEGTVLVAASSHRSWDAATLAASWSDARRAKARGLSFVPGISSLLARTEEQSFGDAELAARHDDPARLTWLADRLREERAVADPSAIAIMVPPWLGVVRARARELSALVGVPCGEALGGVGGPSGLRFEHARDRALALAGIDVVAERAARVAPASNGWHVDAGARLECDAVVLATGGLLGGGLAYTPAASYVAKALPETLRPLLCVTCDAPVRLGMHGEPFEEPSSLFGGAPEQHAWPFAPDPLLDHVGVLVDGDGRAKGAPPGLFAAGEVASAKHRTWLEALAQGARAGRAAARG